MAYTQSKSFELFNKIAQKYDRINRILSLGLDKRWRRSILQYLPKKENQIAVDLASGTAEQILAMASCSHIVQFYGLDLSPEMLAIGKQKIIKAKMQKKVTLRMGSITKIPLPDNFCHIVTISFGIRNVPDPQQCIREMYRILQPGNSTYILEFSRPSSKIIYLPYALYVYCILPILGGWLSQCKSAYHYLSQTIQQFSQEQDIISLLQKGGFSLCKKIPLTCGSVTLYIGTK